MATNLEIMENLENSGNLKNCQNLRENSGKIGIFAEKPGTLREDVKCVSPMKMYSGEFFSLELLRENRKCPGNLREKSGNLVSPKCGHPEDMIHRITSKE